MNDSSLLLSDYRCACGKLLLKGIVFDGNLEIKCKRCGQINKIGAAKLKDDKTHYLLIIDKLGNITNTSESIYPILGYSRSELIGKSITLINRAFPKEIGIKFFGTDTSLNMESRISLDTIHKSKIGKDIPVNIFIKLYSPNGTERYILEYVTIKNDYLSDEGSSQFTENTCDYYFDIDKNGVIEHVSSSMEKLFGFSQENVIGKNYFDFLPLATIVKEKRTFAHFCSKEQSYRVIQDVGLDSMGTSILSDIYFTTRFNEVGVFIGYRALGWITKKP